MRKKQRNVFFAFIPIIALAFFIPNCDDKVEGSSWAAFLASIVSLACIIFKLVKLVIGLWARKVKESVGNTSSSHKRGVSGTPIDYTGGLGSDFANRERRNKNVTARQQYLAPPRAPHELSSGDVSTAGKDMKGDGGATTSMWDEASSQGMSLLSRMWSISRTKSGGRGQVVPEKDEEEESES